MGDWTDYINPILNFGGSLFDTYNKKKRNTGIQDVVANMIQRDFEDQERYNAAAREYNDKVYQNELANQAAGRQASAANAAAAMANQRAGMRQATKANRKLMQGYNQAKEMYKPYAEAGEKALGQTSQMFSGGVDLMGLLNAYLKKPDQMSKLDQSKPASQVYIPLPKR